MFDKVLNTSVGATNEIQAGESLIKSSLHKKLLGAKIDHETTVYVKKPTVKSKTLSRFTPYRDLARRNNLRIFLWHSLIVTPLYG